MKVYLAGIEHGAAIYLDDISISRDDYYLGSFYYFKERYYRFMKTNDFMLDSGAFTFMENKSKSVDWLSYLDRYIDFIRTHNIDLFFELDIDVVVGTNKVRKLRRRLEARTGQRCIPVWHKSRGKQAFIDLCEDYDYIAIGGIVSGEFTKKEYKYFSWFIREAHKRNTKIHGLGLSAYSVIKKYNFDSIDSTAWTYGGKGGFLYQFDGKGMIKEEHEDRRLRLDKAVKHNFEEWVKFQKYLDNGSTQKPAKQTKTIEE